VGAPFDLAGTHWQKRLTAIKCLDLAFLIHTEHKMTGGNLRPAIAPSDSESPILNRTFDSGH
jgi:hypothetical protein